MRRVAPASAFAATTAAGGAGGPAARNQNRPAAPAHATTSRRATPTRITMIAAAGFEARRGRGPGGRASGAPRPERPVVVVVAFVGHGRLRECSAVSPARPAWARGWSRTVWWRAGTGLS